MSTTRRQVAVVEIETEGMMKKANEIYELSKQLKDKMYEFDREFVIKLRETSSANTEDVSE